MFNNVADSGTSRHREGMPKFATICSKEVRAVEGYCIQAWAKQVERIPWVS